MKADLVITGASEVRTCAPGIGEGPSGRLTRTAIAVQGEIVRWVGPENQLSSEVEITSDTVEIDAGGKSVVPGFVDAHTHLVFAGSRREEFAHRSQGKPYEAGGILTTVSATRDASEEDLVSLASGRADRMFAHGTTTAEAKSGYDLTVDGEKRLLEVLNKLHSSHQIDLEITFCGAHAVPDGMDADEFTDLVVNEMTAACAPLARWCDVFCDVGAFTPEQSRRVLQAGQGNGLVPRIHADELAASGGWEVAVELNAASADHLQHLTQEGAAAMAKASVVGVVCPVTALSLGKYPDVAMMRRQGVIVALASDLNSGMAPEGNMQFAMSIATRSMGMTPEETLVAATSGGAASLRRTDIGQIAPGALSDLLLLSTPSAGDLGYHAGVNLVETVIKRGSVAQA